jgi:hypothetical protein
VYINLRNKLFSEIIKVISNFKQYQPLDKLKNILSPKAELLPAKCKIEVHAGQKFTYILLC